jgi:hypothetical protein
MSENKKIENNILKNIIGLGMQKIIKNILIKSIYITKSIKRKI